MHVQEQVHPVKSQGRTRGAAGHVPSPRPVGISRAAGLDMRDGQRGELQRSCLVRNMEPCLRKMLAPFLKVMGASDGFKNG